MASDEPSFHELKRQSKEWHEQQSQKRLAKYRALKLIEVGEVPICDWERLGELVLYYSDQWLKADYMVEAAMRTIKWDAKLKRSGSITEHHLQIAMKLVALGRAMAAMDYAEKSIEENHEEDDSEEDGEEEDS